MKRRITSAVEIFDLLFFRNGKRRMPKRIIYRVQWRKKYKQWRVTTTNPHDDADYPRCFDTKAEAINDAREIIYTVRENDVSELCQLVIYKRNGLIGEERTFGMDPERYEG